MPNHPQLPPRSEEVEKGQKKIRAEQALTAVMAFVAEVMCERVSKSRKPEWMIRSIELVWPKEACAIRRSAWYQVSGFLAEDPDREFTVSCIVLKVGLDSGWSTGKVTVESNVLAMRQFNCDFNRQEVRTEEIANPRPLKNPFAREPGGYVQGTSAHEANPQHH